MMEGFPHRATRESLFCKTCNTVVFHGLMTERDTRESAIASHEPVLACCEVCATQSVFTAGDLRCLREAQPEDLYCKVAGRGRIVLGDWVYVPGQARPAVAMKRFRTGDEELFVLRNADASEFQVRVATPRNLGPEASQGHRLLPLQVSQTLLGDPVYHVPRDAFGKCVGFLYGREPRLLIELEEDHVLVGMPLPAHRTSPDKITLLETVHGLLRGIGSQCDQIRPHVSQGVVLLGGNCQSIPIRQQLTKAVRELPGVRCVVDRVEVEPLVQLSDSEIIRLSTDRIHALPWAVFGLAVDCHAAHLSVQGFVRGARALEDIEQQLASLDGVRLLNNRLRIRPDADPADQARGLQVAASLRNSSSLKKARIRVASIEGTIYLEGEVQSGLQKQTASFAAMWAVRGFRIENNLRISRRTDATTSIQLV